MPTHGLRLTHLTTTRPILRTLHFSLSTHASFPKDLAQTKQQPNKPNKSCFPKRGQTLEQVCELLDFKGKGFCKVAETGFVVMCECDHALLGERFIRRVTRKKDNYTEVLLLLMFVNIILFGSEDNTK